MSFAEETEVVSDGSIWVLWFSGQTGAEQDAIHEQEGLPKWDRRDCCRQKVRSMGWGVVEARTQVQTLWRTAWYCLGGRGVAQTSRAKG